MSPPGVLHSGAGDIRVTGMTARAWALWRPSALLLLLVPGEWAGPGLGELCPGWERAGQGAGSGVAVTEGSRGREREGGQRNTQERSAATSLGDSGLQGTARGRPVPLCLRQEALVGGDAVTVIAKVIKSQILSGTITHIVTLTHIATHTQPHTHTATLTCTHRPAHIQCFPSLAFQSPWKLPTPFPPLHRGSL